MSTVAVATCGEFFGGIDSSNISGERIKAYKNMWVYIYTGKLLLSC